MRNQNNTPGDILEFILEAGFSSQLKTPTWSFLSSRFSMWTLFLSLNMKFLLFFLRMTILFPDPSFKFLRHVSHDILYGDRNCGHVSTDNILNTGWLDRL